MASEPEIFVIRTKLKPAQIAEALESSMDESQLDFIFRVNAAGRRPIIGSVDGNQFRLMRRPGFFSTDYAGIFDANIFEERDGSRIDGKFVKVEFGFPLGSRNRNTATIAPIKIWIAILMVFEAYNAVGSYVEADHPLVNPAAVFAGLFLVILCLSLPIAIRTRRKQREFILDHLKNLFLATQPDKES